MPTRIATNWENAFLRFGSDPPIKIEDVVCSTDEPEEDEYAEDKIYIGLDLASTATYTLEVKLTSKAIKGIMRIGGRGNNWRRMHGKPLIRVPLKERKRKT